MVLGEYDVRSETDCIGDDCADKIQEVPVQSYHMHPDYKLSTFTDDIALIRMSREVEYTGKDHFVRISSQLLMFQISSNLFVCLRQI